MTILSNRRRSIAALYFLAPLLGVHQASKAQLVLCSDGGGVISRRGWRAKWNSTVIEITRELSSDVYVHTAGVEFLYQKPVIVDLLSNINREDLAIASMPPDEVLTFRLYARDKNTAFIVDGIPICLKMAAQRCAARFRDDYFSPIAGIFCKTNTSAARRIDARVSIRRGDEVVAEHFVDDESMSKFLEEQDICRLIHDGVDPLVIEYWVEGKLLASREYSLNGLNEIRQEAISRQCALRSTKECIRDNCYLTTATCRAIGLSDSCWELIALRRMRDIYMLATQRGAEEVENYYRTAPLISRNIDLRPNSFNLYIAIYFLHILPSAILAQLGLFRLASRRYRSLVQALERRGLLRTSCDSKVEEKDGLNLGPIR